MEKITDQIRKPLEAIQKLTEDRLLKRQPYVHYEGDINEEYINDLLPKINQAVHYLEQTKVNPAQQNQNDWEDCRYRWIEALKYAAIRCIAIQVKLSCGMQEHRADEDRRCIDITLSILKDYENAKLNSFIKNV